MSYAVETICVQGSDERNDVYGAISMPIYPSVTYAHPGLNQSTGYAYSRVGNPTRDELQKTVALLEKGTHALAYTSGMAAIASVFELFESGDHLIATDDVYGGSLRLWSSIGAQHGISVDSVDTSDLEAVKASIKPNTKAIFIETPSNPMMKVTDIEAVAKIAKEHQCYLIVDNTFLSPYFQNPLVLGADLVVHSGTKYIGGHNDVLAGFVVTRREDLAEKLDFIYKTVGNCLSSMDSWLVLRGIKTLAIRMEQHQRNALQIANWLREQPQVTEVFYIGLADRKDKELIDRQCSGYGGMISFHVKNAALVEQVLKKVKLIRFAESLGGVESLITYPMVQTHAAVPEELREKLGVNETLLRLSVGIESADDLIEDLKQALS